MTAGSSHELIQRSQLDRNLLNRQESNKVVFLAEPNVYLENTRFSDVDFQVGSACSLVSFDNCAVSRGGLDCEILKELQVKKSDLTRVRFSLSPSTNLAIVSTRLNQVCLKSNLITRGRFEDFSITTSDLSFSTFQETQFKEGVFADDTIYIGSKFLSCIFYGVQLSEQMLDGHFDNCTFKNCIMSSQMKLLLTRNNHFESSESLAVTKVPATSQATQRSDKKNSGDTQQIEIAGRPEKLGRFSAIRRIED